MRGYKMEEFPWEGWTIENGELKTMPNGAHVDIITEKRFRNFELNLNGKNFPNTYKPGTCLILI